MLKKNMMDHTFGKWRVIAEDKGSRKNSKARWICECLCGNRKSVDGYSLRHGDTKSCGKCFDPNPTNLYENNNDGTTTVYCINGKGFLIDTADLPTVSKCQWHINNRGYVVTGSMKPNIKLHRLLLELNKTESDVLVDHISGDTLDNRRENLRICTASENNCNQKISSKNSSGFKGVSYWKRKRKYIAEIVYRDLNGSRIRKIVGRYDTPIEAALAYDRAAVLLHGEFAKTNEAQGLLGGTVCK